MVDQNQGEHIQVSLPKAKSAADLGLDVFNTSFSARGKHKRYIVVTTGVPQFIIDSLQGKKTKVSKEVTNKPKGIPVEVITSETYVQYVPGMNRKFQKGSKRRFMRDAILKYAQTPIRRMDLLELVSVEMELITKEVVEVESLESTFSAFAHRLGMLKAAV